MSVDIYETCGDIIDSFRDRQAKVADLIWINQASISGIDLDRKVSPKTLKRWLTPIDPIQSALTQDHTVQLAGQAEFTCLWFQKPLSTFAQSEGRVMAVTGQAGSGKSVLAASIAERLQRALGRKNFSTLFYAISKSESKQRAFWLCCTILTITRNRLRNSCRYDKHLCIEVALGSGLQLEIG